ncbi:uncharacterized protein LOC113781290 isoform X2 [Coffea eugenioides]|uniref:uncharacterized protein LOC113779285 isoform X2 n=1 Tax=Coffea eugenioides TaxID=49369 RepID=UPI000F60EF56|nr:uncharacterized protein LOC113779285 isoform X2 [Coffea eugenioides]XP_027183003.1 uncharacterized protein LOC113781290 isoform X2 [Coffea eugenioides]
MNSKYLLICLLVTIALHLVLGKALVEDCAWLTGRLCTWLHKKRSPGLHAVINVSSHGDMMPCCNGEIVGSMRYDNLPLLVSLKLMMELPLKLNRQPSFSSLRLQKIIVAA